MIKNIIIVLGMMISLTGCYYNAHINEEDTGRKLSYADTQLLAAFGTSSSSLERAREAIEMGAEINRYDESQIEIYVNPRSKDRIRLLTPIRVAFNQGAIVIVKELIKNGADINMEETDGKTPLMFLADRGDDIEWIELMVSSGADVNHRNSEGLSALDYAASSRLHKGTDVLEYLVEQGAKIDGSTVKRAMEAQKPDYHKVEYLIQECEKNGEKWGVYDGYTLPYHAAFGNTEKLERGFLGSQHRLNETDQYNNSLLMVAATMGNLDTMEYLIRIGYDIQYINHGDDGNALIRAVENGEYEAVKLLIDSGYEFLPYDEKYAYDNELNFAAERGDVEMMKLLLSNGFQLRQDILNIALNEACGSGNVEAIDFLIEEGQKRGIKSDIADGYGLIEAVWQRDMKTIEHLVKKYKVDINRVHSSALRFAAQANDLELVEFLLSQGAKLNLDPDGQQTPLYTAVNWGGIEMVELIVEAGADIEQPVWNEETVVMSAAAESSRILKYLVEKGADINKQSTEGVTCLYYAVISGKRENVDYLLSLGVDTSPIVKDGKTAYQVAKDDNSKEIIKIFKKYGKVQ